MYSSFAKILSTDYCEYADCEKFTMSAVEISNTQPILPLIAKNDRTISRLDFSRFTAGDHGEQIKLCHSLVHSLCNEGFVTLRDHGITKEQIDTVFAWVSETTLYLSSSAFRYHSRYIVGLTREQNKRFFDLPVEAKNKAAHPKQPNPHRGYSYVGQEKLSKVKDFEKGERNAVEVHDIKVGSSCPHLRPSKLG